MAVPDDHVIVLLGATGDLARRKLLPGLFHLAAAGLMPDRYRIVGSARRSFERILSFGSARPGDTAALEAAIERASNKLGGSPRRLFHVAIPPASFEPTVGMLGAAGLAHGARIIVEKPFGTDLRSARDLNAGTTSWPSGSPTACSSRRGTGSTSVSCRSTCRRLCRSKGAPTSTTPRVRTAT